MVFLNHWGFFHALAFQSSPHMFKRKLSKIALTSNLLKHFQAIPPWDSFLRFKYTCNHIFKWPRDTVSQSLRRLLFSWNVSDMFWAHFQMCNMSIHQSATRRKGNVKVGCLSWFGQGRGGDRNRQTGNLLSGSILIQLMSTTGHSKLTHYKIEFSQ